MENNNPAMIKDYEVILNGVKTIYENKKLALYHIGDFCEAHNGELKEYYQNVYNHIQESDKGYDDKSKVEKERYYTLDDYDLADAIEVPAETLESGWYWKKYNDGSGCLVSPNNKDYMIYDLQTGEYQFQRDSHWSFFSTPEEPMASRDFFKAAEKTIKEYGIDLEEKATKFNQLCGDWDFRNINMVEAHLQGIEIDYKKNIIEMSCEWFSPELDEYVSCDGGKIKSKALINKFRDLDLKDKIAVNEYIENIERKIHWNKVNKDLKVQTTKELVNNKIENLDLRNSWCSYGPLKKSFNYESIKMDFRRGTLSDELVDYLNADYGDDGFIELNAYKNLDNDEYKVYLVVTSKQTKKVLDKIEITDKLLIDDLDFIKKSIEDTFHRKDFELC